MWRQWEQSSKVSKCDTSNTYADDTQLYLSIRTSNSEHHLNILHACSTVRHNWYLTNSLLLNADKSDVILLETANQLRLAASVESVEVAGVTLPLSQLLRHST